MDLIERKEKELKRLWQLSQMAKGDFKEHLLSVFWKEYRLHRKNKKFTREIKRPKIVNTLDSQAV